jgi:FtsP/CotA-like multicopper oxidase with cupredoxin domain
MKNKHKGTKARRHSKKPASSNHLMRVFYCAFVPLCLCVYSTILAAQPHTIEVNLDAKISRVTIEPGHEVEAWTYNGDIPGPMIRANVGDRLIVHFSNHLPQPTTVHWHGIRVPFAMDGVPGHSQPEVPPGGTFKYDFILPDAGLFWYHPHVMSALQTGYGLYGAILVEDPAEKVGVAEEKVLVLSDLALEDDGSLMSPAGAGVAARVFGLEGNHLLVNGREHTELTARAGVPERWRIVNAAKSRYFELLMGGFNDVMPFTVIGGDGGLQEFPTEHETLVIAPGERVDAIVLPRGKPGSEINIMALVYDRGYGSGYDGPHDLFTLALTGQPADSTPVRITTHRSIEPLSPVGATDIQIDVTLVQVNEKNIEYRINNIPSEKPQNIPARIGETQIWTIKNETQWSHPFHLHGFFFQVLDDQGEPVRPIAWKDTVDVPYQKTLRIIVRYEDRPGAEGMWMFHCHILDHAEGGLMGMVEVGPHHHIHEP